MPRFDHTAASSTWSGRGWPVSRISDTRSEARRDLSHGQRIQTLAPQLLRVAGGEESARDLHLEERRRLGVERRMERGIGARRLAQQLEIRDDAFDGALRRHGLKVDRDLGAEDVESDRGTERPRRGQV